MGCTAQLQNTGRSMGKCVAQLSGRLGESIHDLAIGIQSHSHSALEKPSLPATDPSTWCTRCSTNSREYIDHCIWSCPLSQSCWQWGSTIMQSSSMSMTMVVQLRPKHVFVAAPLPLEWHGPEKLRHLLKAILCWQIWKNRNTHFMAGKPVDARKIIRKFCHRLSVYIFKDWRSLLTQIHLGKIMVAEAEKQLHSSFGSDTNIWNLHDGLMLQVPLVPLRPP